jgi:hypothetical protein
MDIDEDNKMKRNAGSGARIGWESRGPRPKFFAAPEKNNSPLFLFATVSLSSLSFFFPPVHVVLAHHITVFLLRARTRLLFVFVFLLRGKGL